MIPGARLIILGRQGAGKGTQCVRLSRHYVVPHISTGDMLRTAAREGSELGLMAKQIMEEGGLVGDEVMIGLVDERLRKPDADSRGYILDGFPRTVAQAQALRGSRRRQADPRRRRPRRASARSCSSGCRRGGCAATAVPTTRHVADERRMWICDVCGGDVEHRADDTPDAVNRRLDLYETQTAPLIHHYSKMGLLDRRQRGRASRLRVQARLRRRRRAPLTQPFDHDRQWGCGARGRACRAIRRGVDRSARACRPRGTRIADGVSGWPCSPGRSRFGVSRCRLPPTWRPDRRAAACRRRAGGGRDARTRCSRRRPHTRSGRIPAPVPPSRSRRRLGRWRRACDRRDGSHPTPRTSGRRSRT